MSTSREQQVLNKITDDILCCEICNVMFTTSATNKLHQRIPKTLDCLHTFCSDCLRQSLQPSATHIDCFVCRRATKIDRNLGVDSLKTLFIIQNLLDTCVIKQPPPPSPLNLSLAIDSESEAFTKIICEYCPEDSEECCVTMLCRQCDDLLFCGPCGESHKKAKKFKSHEVVPITSSYEKKRPLRNCTIHKKEELKYICETCEPGPYFCCQICQVDYHRRHKVSSIDKYVSEQKDRFAVAFTEAEQLLESQKKSLAAIETSLRQHRDNLDSNRSKLSITCEIMREIFTNSTKAWLDEFEAQGARIERTLLHDQKAIQTHIANAELIIGQAMRMAKSQSKIEVIEQKETIMEKITEVVVELISLAAPHDLHFVKPEEVDETCAQLITCVTQTFTSNPFILPENICGNDMKGKEEGGKPGYVLVAGDPINKDKKLPSQRLSNFDPRNRISVLEDFDEFADVNTDDNLLCGSTSIYPPNRSLQRHTCDRGGSIGGGTRASELNKARQGIGTGLGLSTEKNSIDILDVCAKSYPHAPPKSQPPIKGSNSGIDIDKLVNLSHTEQVNYIGEILYSKIHVKEPSRAGRITGMLLEMDVTELLHLLDSPELLNEKIAEAAEVLEET